MKCRICDNEANNQLYEVREMMYGYRDVFRYFQCPSCGCLQIEEIPVDIFKYYRDDYYSLKPVTRPTKRKFKNALIRLRDRYAAFGEGLIGRFLCVRYPNASLKWASLVPINRDAHILDVGCGSGALLFLLGDLGCKNLLGIDPFIATDVEYESGLRILKKSVHEVGGKWNLIMFHHSFEHVPDPLATLQAVSGLLTPNGCCVIRVPTVSSYAWEHYRVNWVQLDAPRHCYLHSVESMRFLAQRAGLELCKTVYDSTSFQFSGSEQYRMDIPLLGELAEYKKPRAPIFTKRQLAAFAVRAAELNECARGDQAAFYLRKPQAVKQL